MSLLARFRQRQTPWAQRVLGLFVVVWLNMALQPCAMAFGDTHQHDVDHCPPEMSGQMLPAGNSDSHSDQMQDEQCNAQCAFLDDYNYDGRTVQIKAKHAPSDVPPGVIPFVTTSQLPNFSRPNQSVNDSVNQIDVRSPLNLLFCVYQI